MGVRGLNRFLELRKGVERSPEHHDFTKRIKNNMSISRITVKVMVNKNCLVV